MQLSSSKIVTALSMKFWGLGNFPVRNRHIRTSDTFDIKKGGGGTTQRREDKRIGI